MQTVINIKCLDQTLTLESSPIIASGGLHENFIMFDFCEKWDGLEKVTTFYAKTGKTYYSPVVDGLCEIPHEVTDNAGTIEFGVFGVANDVTKTSELVKYNIKQGAITETSKPSDPTPEIWEQILAVVQESNAVSKAHIANSFNPHNVTKEQVGLGNVPNVSTNDQTPTFTMAAERLNIQSGDKLTVMLGKIAKIFSEIKTGAFKAVANSLDIGADGYVLDARQGKILSERVHDVQHGGTNADNTQDAKKNLGILYSETIPAEPPVTGEGTICFVRNDNAPLPIIGGGTGSNEAEEGLLNLGGVKMEKLWENASPSSSFEAQNITLNNLSDYNYLMVNIIQSVNYSYEHAILLNIKDNSTHSILVAPLAVVNNLLMAYGRSVSITKSSNTFSISAGAKHDTNSQTATTDNACGVPISIYGIKGVK